MKAGFVLFLLVVVLAVLLSSVSVFEDGSFLLGGIGGCFPWAICW